MSDEPRVPFTLELFVKWIAFNDTYEFPTQPALAFRLLDFPAIILTPPSSTPHIAPLPNSSGSSTADKFMLLDCNKGKACLLQLTEAAVRLILTSQPMYILLLDLAHHSRTEALVEHSYGLPGLPDSLPVALPPPHANPYRSHTQPTAPRAPALSITLPTRQEGEKDLIPVPAQLLAASTVSLSPFAEACASPATAAAPIGYRQGCFSLISAAGQQVACVELVARLAAHDPSLLPHLSAPTPESSRSGVQHTAYSAPLTSLANSTYARKPRPTGPFGAGLRLGLLGQVGPDGSSGASTRAERRDGMSSTDRSLGPRGHALEAFPEFPTDAGKNFSQGQMFQRPRSHTQQPYSPTQPSGFFYSRHNNHIQYNSGPASSSHPRAPQQPPASHSYPNSDLNTSASTGVSTFPSFASPRSSSSVALAASAAAAAASAAAAAAWEEEQQRAADEEPVFTQWAPPQPARTSPRTELRALQQLVNEHRHRGGFPAPSSLAGPCTLVDDPHHHTAAHAQAPTLCPTCAAQGHQRCHHIYSHVAGLTTATVTRSRADEWQGGDAHAATAAELACSSEGGVCGCGLVHRTRAEWAGCALALGNIEYAHASDFARRMRPHTAVPHDPSSAVMRAGRDEATAPTQTRVHCDRLARHKWLQGRRAPEATYEEYMRQVVSDVGHRRTACGPSTVTGVCTVPRFELPEWAKAEARKQRAIAERRLRRYGSRADQCGCGAPHSELNETEAEDFAEVDLANAPTRPSYRAGEEEEGGEDGVFGSGRSLEEHASVGANGDQGSTRASAREDTHEHARSRSRSRARPLGTYATPERSGSRIRRGLRPEWNPFFNSHYPPLSHTPHLHSHARAHARHTCRGSCVYTVIEHDDDVRTDADGGAGETCLCCQFRCPPDGPCEPGHRRWPAEGDAGPAGPTVGVENGDNAGPAQAAAHAEEAPRRRSRIDPGYQRVAPLHVLRDTRSSVSHVVGPLVYSPTRPHSRARDRRTRDTYDAYTRPRTRDEQVTAHVPAEERSELNCVDDSPKSSANPVDTPKSSRGGNTASPAAVSRTYVRAGADAVAADRRTWRPEQEGLEPRHDTHRSGLVLLDSLAVDPPMRRDTGGRAQQLDGGSNRIYAAAGAGVHAVDPADEPLSALYAREHRAVVAAAMAPAGEWNARPSIGAILLGHAPKPASTQGFGSYGHVQGGSYNMGRYSGDEEEKNSWKSLLADLDV